MGRPREFDPEHALDSAMDAFWEKGFATTTAQDLVDRTGLGRGSLYNTFDSKHGLFQEVLRRYEALWTAHQEDVLAGPGTVHQRIRNVLLTVVDEETGGRTRRGCLAVNAAIELAGRDPDVTNQIRKTFQRMENALHKAIRQAQLEGEISRSGDARVLARYVLNSMYGLRVLGKTASREALTDIVEMVLRGL